MSKSHYKLAIVILDAEDLKPGIAAAYVADSMIKVLESDRDGITRAEMNWAKEPNNIILQASKCDALTIFSKCLDNNLRVITLGEEYLGCKSKKKVSVKTIIIGPDKSSVIDKVTGNLKLYN